MKKMKNKMMNGRKGREDWCRIISQSCALRIDYNEESTVLSIGLERYLGDSELEGRRQRIGRTRMDEEQCIKKIGDEMESG